MLVRGRDTVAEYPAHSRPDIEPFTYMITSSLHTKKINTIISPAQVRKHRVKSLAKTTKDQK